MRSGDRYTHTEHDAGRYERTHAVDDTPALDELMQPTRAEAEADEQALRRGESR